ncbi:hypothetical protein EJ04DRAFT_172414 [Polyplosphaeria fusca]|uniref:Uncharacterized protein n=1 Tax=Polyplosphaeria fusca TaxID=682080 RepID=A0A9P4V323_9PLEO|nr:hypothetical protein EJ04DRAFT_172414 [Polyplosphaeria fusca]
MVKRAGGERCRYLSRPEEWYIAGLGPFRLEPGPQATPTLYVTQLASCAIAMGEFTRTSATATHSPGFRPQRNGANQKRRSGWGVPGDRRHRRLSAPNPPSSVIAAVDAGARGRVRAAGAERCRAMQSEWGCPARTSGPKLPGAAVHHSAEWQPVAP